MIQRRVRPGRPGLGRRLVALGAAALLVGTLWPSMVSGATPFGNPSAEATYGTGVTFRQPFTPPTDLRRVEILVSAPDSIGPAALVVPTPACCQETTLDYTLAEADSHIVPNTTLTARWRVTLTNGSTILGEPTSVVYSDTRFAWQTQAGPIVRVHWYDGSDAFGKRALAIGERGVADAAKLLGVTESRPIDFYIYADQAAFYAALGPGTRENVGGEAHADIRTMFALITPDEIDASWVSTVVPHELTHLVFDTAVRNPYHFPPRWLNEGLAVYLSEGYTDAWRTVVTNTVRSGGIIPLIGLTGQFPTTRDQFFLAYGESVSAVDYMVRTFGRDGLVKLVRSYADGVSDDEAFQAGIGRCVADCQAGWVPDLGATAPQAIGPRIGPAGPLPPGWQAAPGAPVGGPATPRPGSVPSTVLHKDDGGDPAVVVLIALIVGIVGAVVILGLRARRRRTVIEP